MKITKHSVVKITVDEQEMYIEIDFIPTLIEELRSLIEEADLGMIKITSPTIKDYLPKTSRPRVSGHKYGSTSTSDSTHTAGYFYET